MGKQPLRTVVYESTYMFDLINLACAFTGMADLFCVDQSILAMGTIYHVLGAIILINNDFGCTIALRTSGTDSENTSAVADFTSRHRASPFSAWVRVWDSGDDNLSLHS